MAVEPYPSTVCSQLRSLTYYPWAGLNSPVGLSRDQTMLLGGSMCKILVERMERENTLVIYMIPVDFRHSPSREMILFKTNYITLLPSLTAVFRLTSFI